MSTTKAPKNLWLTQKLMATLYDVTVPAINQHLKRIFADRELDEQAVIKPYLITAADGKNYQVKHYSLQDAGKVTAELAKAHAESEFEQYRIVQDRLFESDFDRVVEETKRLGEGDATARSRKGKKP